MMRTEELALVLTLSAAVLGAGCSDAGDPAPPRISLPGQIPVDDGSSTTPDGPGSTPTAPGAAEDGSPADIKRATRPLQWKRYATFESDLSQALELPKDELCLEFGTTPCIHGVHLSPLGGHDPFATGLLESPAEPLGSTPTVVERVVLKACIARIEKDRAAEPVVFKGLDWGKEAPARDSAQTKDLITSLYRRFLARDPEPLELSVTAELAVDDGGAPVMADTFASTACLLVGSSTEFLFF